MEFIFVEVVNYEKYRGRHDVERPSWFRCSNGLIEDDDLATLTAAELCAFVYILCLSSQQTSKIVRISTEKVSALKCKFTLDDLQKTIDKLVVPNYKGQQILRKVKNGRGTSAVRPRNVGGTSAAEIYTHPTDKTDKTGEPNSGELEPSFMEIWNTNAPSRPKIKLWNNDRAKAAAKIMEKFGAFEWTEACRRVQASEFLSGRNRKWKGCGVDWLLNPKNLTKVLEGNYENDDGPPDRRPQPSDSFCGVADV